MKAVALTRYLPISNPESLVDVEVPKPKPLDNDLLVPIEAVSVNPVDTKVRAPKDRREKKPKILGWDAAGVVEAVGKSVTRFKVGDEVYYAGDMTRQGSNAQFPAGDERLVGAQPEVTLVCGGCRVPADNDHRLGIDFEKGTSGKSLLMDARSTGH